MYLNDVFLYVFSRCMQNSQYELIAPSKNMPTNLWHRYAVLLNDIKIAFFRYWKVMWPSNETRMHFHK